MAATGATLHPGLSARVHPRTPRLPQGWPVYALFLGFPLWWVLGLAAFIWPIMAVPMALSLMARERVRVPRGFGLYLLFVIWMLASGLELTGPDRIFGFVYRASLYASAGILCLYLYNAPKRLLPTSAIVRTMVLFWTIVVAGGIYGILAPAVEFKTLAESLVPQRLLANDFVYQLVHPATAQVQTFLGYPVPRPKAPFVFTNDWGGAFALLVPFLLAGWSQIRSFARRGLVRLIAAVSLVPVVFSLNRVLWLSIVVGVIYGSMRFALRGRVGALQGVFAIMAVGSLLFIYGPTRQLIDDRIATPHSNQGRTTLYKEATEQVAKSPLLGYGAPRPSRRNPNLPSVGTQGQFWLVLFSHGIPATVFFVSWFLYAFWRTRRAASSTALWCHVVVLLALVQMPFYGLLSAQLHIVLVAMAVAFRESAQPDPPVALAAAPTTNGHAVPAINGNGAYRGSHG